MRNPPNYGSIVNLGKNRRRPLGVRVPNGYKLREDKTEIIQYRYIGYFENTPQGKKDAMLLLAQYNNGLNTGNVVNVPTFLELSSEWLERHRMALETKGSGNIESNISHLKMAQNKTTSINNKPINKISFGEVQAIADSVSNMGSSTVHKLKSLINNTFDLARKKGYIEKNFIEDVEFNYKKSEESIHTDFTDDEIAKLWELKDDDSVKMLLIMIYTGLRATEFMRIKNENIHIEERYMIGGMKTEAGTDRTIPLSMKIIPFIEHFMSDNEYLINDKGNKFYYDHFMKVFWNPTMKRLKMKHLPHDTRYTTATLLDRANANQNTIKDILGHAREGVTARVYIQKNLQDLLDAIDLI